MRLEIQCSWTRRSRDPSFTGNLAIGTTAYKQTFDFNTTP